MKNLIVFDSQFGNTEKVAGAIAGGINAKTLKTDEVKPYDLEGLKLLIVGSPTQGGRPTVSIQQFLNRIRAGSLKGVSVAAFDTRLNEKELNFALKLLVKTIGYAAPKIAITLVAKGGKELIEPEGFMVKGKEGPLAEGELKRARNWITK